MESICLALFDDSFAMLLQEVSGKIRLDSEDPKWQLFFRNKNVIYLQGIEVGWKSFFELLVMNNPHSGNLLMIFEQTTSRIQQIINKKNKPSLLLLEQCCSALHIATLVIHYLCSHLKLHELRKQLGLPHDWPNCQQHEKFHIQAHNTGDITLKSIFEAVFIILQMNPVQPWLYDLSFFCANFLLASFTCQLYGTDQTLSMSANQDNYCFLNYIYNLSSVQLRAAMSRADGDISSTLAAKLTRALLVHTVDKMPAPSNSLCSLLIRHHTSSSFRSENHSTSNFLMDTLALSTQLPFHTYQSLGSLLQLPVSAWQSMMSYLQLQLPFPSFLSNHLRLPTNQQLPRYIQDSNRNNINNNISIDPNSMTAGTSPNTQIHNNNSINNNNNNNNNRSNVNSTDSISLDNSSLNENGSSYYEESSSSTASSVKLKLSDTPLSERSSTVLLILLNNRRSTGLPNPFREVFHVLNDEMMAAAGGEGGDGVQGQGVDTEMLGSSRPVLTTLSHNSHSSSSSSQSRAGFGGSMMSNDHLSFPVIADHLAKGLLVDTSRECTSLLLYAYLQTHPHFLEAVLATSSGNVADREINFILRKIVGNMWRGSKTIGSQDAI